jgi:hypothetical protein
MSVNSKYYLSCTCSIWAGKLHWLDKCLLYTVTDQNIAFSGIPAGADPGFQDRGAGLKILRRAEGCAKKFGYFVWKITILRQTIIFFSNFRGGGARRVRPPLDPPLPCHILSVELCEPSCKKSLNIPKE